MSFNKLNEEYPVPKSSTEILKPKDFRFSKIFLVSSIVLCEAKITSSGFSFSEASLMVFASIFPCYSVLRRPLSS